MSGARSQGPASFEGGMGMGLWETEDQTCLKQGLM